MDTRTGAIRELAQDEVPSPEEVLLDYEQAREALTMPPGMRPEWWERVTGKDRSGSRQPKGSMRNVDRTVRPRHKRKG